MARSATANAFTDRGRDLLIGLARIAIGLLFFEHGAASLFGWFGGGFGGGSVPFGTWPGWWAALIQLVGGAFVVLGLFTRIAAIICSGSMAYAYFVVHQPHAALPIQNGGDPPSLFAWSFLVLAIVGPGALALDGLVAGRRPEGRAVTDEVTA